MKNKPYWLEQPLIKGSRHEVQTDEILVIGSGLAGASAAYWLNKLGYSVTIVDHEPEKSASFRNAGHILFGTGESYRAMKAIYGPEKAKKIMSLSKICNATIKQTIIDNEIDCDLTPTARFFATDKNEEKELSDAVRDMYSDGFRDTVMISSQSGNECAFGVSSPGVRICTQSASAHPVKFRNWLMAKNIVNDVNYHEAKVLDLQEKNGEVEVTFENQKVKFQAVVICANAYSPTFSKFHDEHKLAEPFKGQIMVSEPFKKKSLFRGAHSFEHGYIYANWLPDNRLLIGGWRNNVEGGEKGTYGLELNPDITRGLKKFVKERYILSEEPNWEYEWTGIMATSHSGLPSVGPTNSPYIFTCSGFTGYGFGFAHGCAKILADIMEGNDLPEGWELLKP